MEELAPSDKLYVDFRGAVKYTNTFLSAFKMMQKNPEIINMLPFFEVFCIATEFHKYLGREYGEVVATLAKESYSKEKKAPGRPLNFSRAFKHRNSLDDITTNIFTGEEPKYKFLDSIEGQEYIFLCEHLDSGYFDQAVGFLTSHNEVVDICTIPELAMLYKVFESGSTSEMAIASTIESFFDIDNILPVDIIERLELSSDTYKNLSFEERMSQYFFDKEFRREIQHQLEK